MARGISKVIFVEEKNKTIKGKLSQYLELMRDVVTGKRGDVTKKERRALNRTRHIVSIILPLDSNGENRHHKIAVRLLEKALSALNKKLIKVDSKVQHRPNLFVIFQYRLKPSQDGKSDSLKGNLTAKHSTLSYFQWSNTCNEMRFT